MNLIFKQQKNVCVCTRHFSQLIIHNKQTTLIIYLVPAAAETATAATEVAKINRKCSTEIQVVKVV